MKKKKKERKADQLPVLPSLLQTQASLFSFFSTSERAVFSLDSLVELLQSLYKCRIHSFFSLFLNLSSNLLEIIVFTF